MVAQAEIIRPLETEFRRLLLETELAVMQVCDSLQASNLAIPSKFFPIRRGCGEMPKNLLDAADQKYKEVDEMVRF